MASIYLTGDDGLNLADKIRELSVYAEPESISDNKFIEALITDTNPEDYCTGEVLYRVSTRQTTASEVISVNSSVIDSSRNFARVYIIAEMRLEAGVDVGFYEAELIKEDGWKVYALRETMPRVDSFSLPGKPDVGSVYEKSFSELSQGDISSLAGAARTAYKPQVGVKGEISNLQTNVLFNNKLVVAKHSYVYDGRLVKVLAHYYMTSEGYKIVAIQAI